MVSEIEGRELGEVALQGALSRLQQEETSRDGCVISTSEALFWIAALEDWHEKRMGPTYYETRGASHAGRITGAVIWARNQVAHELKRIAAMIVTGGLPMSIPFASGGSIDCNWVQTFDAPPDKHGRDDWYRAYVAGRPVLPTLREAHSFLREL